MARNEEKAQMMLNRFIQAKKDLDGKGFAGRARRPFIAGECTNLQECERWRRQIVKEIGKKVSEIQNPGLGEHKVRDLNDEINKLIREKSHWDKQILSLGGPDYARGSSRMFDGDGKEVPGTRGYKYFGAAKDLPGVRELFEEVKAPPPKRTRYELHRAIDHDYYGFRDDDDGMLGKLEAEAEREAVKNAIRDYDHAKEERRLIKATLTSQKKKRAAEDDEDEDGDWDDEARGEAGSGAEDDEKPQEEEEQFKSYVALPSQEEIEAMLVERRKKELLAKYCSDEMQTREGESKSLLGR